jgi:hypothetical protein
MTEARPRHGKTPDLRENPEIQPSYRHKTRFFGLALLVCNKAAGRPFRTPSLASIDNELNGQCHELVATQCSHDVWMMAR